MNREAILDAAQKSPRGWRGDVRPSARPALDQTSHFVAALSIDTRPPENRYRSGFTIIELIVVMLIIGFIAIVATTDVLDFSALRERAAAQKIQSDIRYIQQLAVARQERTGILFDAAGNSYTAYYLDPPSTWVVAHDPLTRQAFTVDFDTADGFDGVSITNADFDGEAVDAVIFDEMGTPYDFVNFLTAGGTVELNSNTDINITPITGKVDITTS